MEINFNSTNRRSDRIRINGTRKRNADQQQREKENEEVDNDRHGVDVDNNDDDDDDDDDDEFEVSRIYVGGFDCSGLYDGRGTLKTIRRSSESSDISDSEEDDSDVDRPVGHRTRSANQSRLCEVNKSTNLRTTVFDGHFRHGQKHGSSLTSFPDGSSLSAVYQFGRLHGPSLYTSADGDSIRGSYTNNQLNGNVVEEENDEEEEEEEEEEEAEFEEEDEKEDEEDDQKKKRGNKRRRSTRSGKKKKKKRKTRVVYEGEYYHGERHGFGRWFVGDGGVFEGEWFHGSFHGLNNIFYYPRTMDDNVRYSFRGEWQHGTLVSASFYCNDTVVSSLSSTIYSSDESSFVCIASSPLLPDPYESICCYVAPASVSKDAGEGLFAKIPLPANTVVSFYNGIKQLDRVTERNHWRLNSNAISLDEDEHIDIDVPKPYDSLLHYQASLGHKANHSFDPNQRNSKYDVFFHPRFGRIKCIRTLREIQVGEELLVDYGYSKGPNSGPEWYKKEMKKRRATAREEKEKERKKGEETEQKNREGEGREGSATEASNSARSTKRDRRNNRNIV